MDSSACLKCFLCLARMHLSISSGAVTTLLTVLTSLGSSSSLTGTLRLEMPLPDLALILGTPFQSFLILTMFFTSLTNLFGFSSGCAFCLASINESTGDGLFHIANLSSLTSCWDFLNIFCRAAQSSGTSTLSGRSFCLSSICLDMSRFSFSCFSARLQMLLIVSCLLSALFIG